MPVYSTTYPFDHLDESDLRQLAFLAFVGMPREQYVYDYALEYCRRYGISRDAWGDTIDALRLRGYIDAHDEVTTDCYLKVTLHVLSVYGDWKPTFNTICKFRDSKAIYLWKIAEHILRDDVARAASVSVPLTGVGGARLNVYRYLQPIIAGHGKLFSILPRAEVPEMMASVCYEMFSAGRLTMESIEQQLQALPSDAAGREEVEDMMRFYRYMVDGIADNGNGTWWSVAVEAISLLYADNVAEALRMFCSALSLQRKGRKKAYFEHCPIINYFYGLCMLRWKRANPSSPCPQLMEFRQAGEVKLSPELFHIRLLCDYADVSGATMQGIISRSVAQAADADASLLRRHMAHLVLSYFNVTADDLHPVDTMPHSMILQHELSPYLPVSVTQKMTLASTYGGPSLLSRLRRKAPWEEVLGDIMYHAQMNVDDDDASSRASKLYYFVEGMSLNAVVRMHHDVSGRLVDDEVISRNQFLHLGFSSDDVLDVRAAHALVTKDEALHDVQILLPLLAQSGRVITGRFVDSLFGPGFSPAHIVNDTPYIEFIAKGDSIYMGTNVDISSDVSLRHTVSLDAEGTYHIVSTTAPQRSVISKLSSVSRFPSSAIMAIRKVVSSINGVIEVRDNIISPDMGRVIKGNSRVGVRLTPDRLDFHFTINARPAPDGQMYFVPGVGEDIVYDETDGLTQCYERNLAAEYENYKALSDFLLSRNVVEFDDDYSGTVYSTSSLLLLLSHVYDHQDQYYIEWPQGQLLRFRGSVTHDDVQIVVKSNTRWFELDGEANVAGERKNLDHLLALYSRADSNGFVRLGNDEYIRISDTLRKHLEMLDALPSLSSAHKRLPVYQVGALAKIIDKMHHSVVDDGYTDMLKLVKEVYSADYLVPDGLKATLRDYQTDGYVWMRRLDAWGAGSCLADDMGLGKTLQALAFMLSKAADGPSLVVMPKSVLPNWTAETSRFAPSLHILIVNNTADRQMLVQNAGPSDLLLCTYGILVTESALLSSRKWNVVCLDEAQQIKNHSTMASQAAMKLNAQSRVALTGTPLQNHMGELWTLFQYLNPGLLGPWKRFYNTFVKPDLTPHLIEELQSLTQPFILRRTKDSVLDDLPDKLVGEHIVEMTPEEKEVYETMRKMAEVKFKDKRLKTSAERAESRDLNLIFFDELTKLRLASCSMQLVHSGWTMPSSKISSLVDMLSVLMSNPSNNVLVFSQFTSFLSLIRVELDKNGYDYLYLDGQTSISSRQDSIRQFQSGQKKLFLLSLKAGGLGVNLTAANYVIILDPWWNPAIENQAMDRAHRIGQKRCVSVIRLITKDSIEEKILRLHERKQNLSDTILDGTSETYKLTYDDILELVSPHT